MARKKKHEEHENHERWLVSYADFITLLFAFFTSMYAISSVNEGKFRVLSESIAVAFNPSLYTDGKKEAGPRFMQEETTHFSSEFKSAFSNRFQKALASLSALERNKRFSLIVNDENVIIRLSEGMLFESGNDVLNPEGAAVLDELAEALRDMPNEVVIEGHTDNIPINTPRFPTNWDLSSSRSLKILKYFIERHRYDPTRLSAIGYGEFRPVDTNDTPAGRARNRRVDILVVR